jgi:sporulation protein YlmC with PRC-barrel domain
MLTVELRGAARPTLEDARGWIGYRVEDVYGAGIGRLEDVIADPQTDEPRWLLVREGRFGGHRTLIPFDDATAAAGYVWIPYERSLVRDAPHLAQSTSLTDGLQERLRDHYSKQTA